MRTTEEKKRVEDRRIANRREILAASQRKLVPLMVAACESFRVTPDDVLSQSRHPRAVKARKAVVWLAWNKLAIGSTYIADLLSKDRVGISQMLARMRKKMTPEMRAEIYMVEQKMQSLPSLPQSPLQLSLPV